jgi:hypothetical protein
VILLSSFVCVSQEHPDRQFFVFVSMLGQVCAMHPQRQRSLQNHNAPEHSSFIYAEM